MIRRLWLNNTLFPEKDDDGEWAPDIIYGSWTMAMKSRKLGVETKCTLNAWLGGVGGCAEEQQLDDKINVQDRRKCVSNNESAVTGRCSIYWVLCPSALCVWVGYILDSCRAALSSLYCNLVVGRPVTMQQKRPALVQKCGWLGTTTIIQPALT